MFIKFHCNCSPTEVLSFSDIPYRVLISVANLDNILSLLGVNKCPILASCPIISFSISNNLFSILFLPFFSCIDNPINIGLDSSLTLSTLSLLSAISLSISWFLLVASSTLFLISGLTLAKNVSYLSLFFTSSIFSFTNSSYSTSSLA